MKFFRQIILLLAAICACAHGKLRVIVLAEEGGQHGAYVNAARKWLNQLGSTTNFTVDYIDNTEKINDYFLSQYQLFIQLNYPPYDWTKAAEDAFVKYIDQGLGGWIGFHHATLLGEFDGFKMWNWFHDFMGGIRFTNYIAKFASATVKVEDQTHPTMKGVPNTIFFKQDEWYTYDHSPRKNVHVIASVEESTYKPNTDVKMGDHPVVWSNLQKKAKNVYIFMGHSPILFDNESYKTMFKNAIFWASEK